MHRIAIVLVILALVLVPGCKQKDQPAESATTGNATDRAADGTSGTGAPQSPAAGSTAAAEQLGTVAPSAASTAVAITGTADVHASKTETTSTITGPDGTSTIAVATPAKTTTAVTPKKP
jgi:hypothetical protein